jgi:hypothetical protein
MQSLYYISIEPICSQGVGNYEMITNNINYGEKLRQELFKFAKYIKSLNDFDVCEWVFSEHIYKVNEIDENNEITYKISNIHSQDYNFNIVELVQIDWNFQIDTAETLECDEKLKLNMVYNNIDNSVKPCKINKFNILKKN